ncbi:MAG: hypothetical protein IKU78_03100 [Paludibacteraceae bacterium]|nr:hypothetical protein [Paludibacteraceae bacterium]
MKKCILILVFAYIISSFFTLNLHAQNNNLALKVIVADQPEPFPNNAKSQLVNKLNLILTKNGLASADVLNRFFVTVVATPSTKDVIPGPPMQIAQSMDFTFYIADYYTQVIYSTAMLSSKGVGTNDNKSYMDAIKRLNINNSEVASFVKEGKEKIIKYFNENADKMLLEIRTLAKQREYEKALFLLTGIPYDCKKYTDFMALADDVYQQYVDYLCDINLAEAKAIWASSQNADGAALAGEYLAQILPDAKCYADAENLYKEIKGKVLDDWKFEMKKYQDEVDLESQRIEAWKSIGTAYGEGQQPTTTNIAWLH